MIEILPEPDGRLLAVKASRKLTDVDYKEIWIPKTDELIEKFGKIRVLVYMAKDFSGWDLRAAWDDAVFGIKHRNDFEKLAVVGGGNWIEWGTKLAAHLMSGEVRTFSDDRLQKALYWVRS